MGDPPASRRALLRAVAVTPLLAACGSPESSPSRPTRTPSSAPPATSSPTPSPSTTSSAASPSTPPVSPAAGPPSLRVAGTIAEGLAVPWGIVFLPGGDALVGERDTARVLRVGPRGVQEIGEVPGVAAGGEGGLLGFALYPAGDQLYAYRTTDRGNEVVRMPLSARSLGRPQVVLSGIEASSRHNGGGLLFAPDGTLFVSTGDATRSASAPDPDSLNGKILRITDRGGVPPSNPRRNPVFSTGHRNVEGLALDPQGRLWASEFGENTYDELNRIVPGGDYGWPRAEGKDGPGGSRDPLAQWSTDECSPSGLAIVGAHAFLGALRGESVWSVDLSTGRSRRWLEGHGRLRLVAAAPDGSLWVGTSNKDGRGSPSSGDDRILRVTL